MDRIAADVAQLKIRRVNGDECALGEIWATQPVVVAFVRHFG